MASSSSSGSAKKASKSKVSITFIEFQNVVRKWQQAHEKLVAKLPEVVQMRADISRQSAIRVDSAVGANYSASNVLSILLEKLEDAEGQLRNILADLTKYCNTLVGSNLLSCVEPSSESGEELVKSEPGANVAAASVPVVNTFPLHADVLRRAVAQVLQQTNLDVTVIHKICGGGPIGQGKLVQEQSVAGTAGVRSLSVEESTTLMAAVSYAPYLNSSNSSGSGSVSELDLILKHR